MEIVHNHHVDVICLQETIITKMSAWDLNSLSGNRIFSWNFLPMGTQVACSLA
jgi:exonuclease III